MLNKNGQTVCQNKSKATKERSIIVKRIDHVIPGQETESIIRLTSNSFQHAQVINVYMEDVPWLIEQLHELTGSKNPEPIREQPVTDQETESFIESISRYDDVPARLKNVHDHCVHHSMIDIDENMRGDLWLLYEVATKLSKFM